MLTFITGGVRSGKSSLAEQLAIQAAVPAGRLLYMACGQVTDEEMLERVRRHQFTREASGHDWVTVEQSAAIGSIPIRPSDTVLIDCLTTLLAGEWMTAGAAERIVQDVKTIAAQAHAVVAVSNELSFEQSAGGMVTEYMKSLGIIHQDIVAASDCAVLVECGIPIVKKGRLL